MSRLRSRRRARSRGYTFVELMMALALFSVAVLGIISLQKITVTSNTHSKNIAIAQRIAQSWAGHLEMDATTWRNGFGSGWLNSTAIWQRPAYIADRNFGGAFDALGNPLTDSATDLGRARFCAHVRMSWLYPQNLSVGNGMLRAEIRVFWQRDGAAPLDSNTTLCSSTQTAAQAKNIGLSPDRYHFIYQTVGVRQHFQI